VTIPVASFLDLEHVCNQLNILGVLAFDFSRSGTISIDGNSANVSDRASECAIVRGVVTESSEAYELSNVVETALARALLLAAEAGRWDVVGRIAAELEGRRTGWFVPAGLTKASR
jgi:hypothetical protein